ncbi:hypothetical protein FGO68_gene9317 [Halteria grandinella]|uniref:Uncharacterized protein n=1 Tax=Halteria grandinella TaxID=5974 RepID=A0A8J8NYU6_HALGN|nr:hypothetical protein FGO68_gene9317 [Halteria grandinella]
MRRKSLIQGEEEIYQHCDLLDKKKALYGLFSIAPAQSPTVALSPKVAFQPPKGWDYKQSIIEKLKEERAKQISGSNYQPTPLMAPPGMNNNSITSLSPPNLQPAPIQPEGQLAAQSFKLKDKAAPTNQLPSYLPAISPKSYSVLNQDGNVPVHSTLAPNDGEPVQSILNDPSYQLSGQSLKPVVLPEKFKKQIRAMVNWREELEKVMSNHLYFSPSPDRMRYRQRDQQSSFLAATVDKADGGSLERTRKNGELGQQPTTESLRKAIRHLLIQRKMENKMAQSPSISVMGADQSRATLTTKKRTNALKPINPSSLTNNISSNLCGTRDQFSNQDLYLLEENSPEPRGRNIQGLKKDNLDRHQTIALQTDSNQSLSTLYENQNSEKELINLPGDINDQINAEEKLKLQEKFRKNLGQRKSKLREKKDAQTSMLSPSKFSEHQEFDLRKINLQQQSINQLHPFDGVQNTLQTFSSQGGNAAERILTLQRHEKSDMSVNSAALTPSGNHLQKKSFKIIRPNAITQPLSKVAVSPKHLSHLSPPRDIFRSPVGGSNYALQSKKVSGRPGVQKTETTQIRELLILVESTESQGKYNGSPDNSLEKTEEEYSDEEIRQSDREDAE